MKRIIALLSLLLLVSCASKKPYSIDLMPAPDIYTEGGLDPFKGLRETNDKIPERVFYVTDREPATEEEKKKYKKSSQRNKKKRSPYYNSNRGHVLRLGTAGLQGELEEISWDEVREITLKKDRKKKYPISVGDIDEIGILNATFNKHPPLESTKKVSEEPARKYAALINAHLAQSHPDNKDIIVYVHGFKTIFDTSVLIAAELWHFLGYDGVVIAYSWPATPSNFAYGKDIETTRYATRNFRTFLKYLADETDVKRIHILGYSAGSRVVLNALHEIGLMYYTYPESRIRKDLKMGSVILVGSDVDRDIARKFYWDGFHRVPTDTTVYVSKTDKALGMASWFLSEGRMGQYDALVGPRPGVITQLKNSKRVVAIDATQAKGSQTGNGHSYFVDSPWVSSDVLLTLFTNMSPEERGLIQNKETGVWSFPEDYVEKLKGIVDKHAK